MVNKWCCARCGRDHRPGHPECPEQRQAMNIQRETDQSGVSVKVARARVVQRDRAPVPTAADFPAWKGPIGGPPPPPPPMGGAVVDRRMDDLTRRMDDLERQTAERFETVNRKLDRILQHFGLTRVDEQSVMSAVPVSGPPAALAAVPPAATEPIDHGCAMEEIDDGRSVATIDDGRPQATLDDGRSVTMIDNGGPPAAKAAVPPAAMEATDDGRLQATIDDDGRVVTTIDDGRSVVQNAVHVGGPPAAPATEPPAAIETIDDGRAMETIDDGCAMATLDEGRLVATKDDVEWWTLDPRFNDYYHRNLQGLCCVEELRALFADWRNVESQTGVVHSALWSDHTVDFVPLGYDA